MRSDRVWSKNRGEMMADALRETTCVDKNQRGAICEHEVCDALVDFFPHLVRSHWAKLAGWNFDSQIQMAPLRNLDDCRSRPVIACEKICYQLDRLLSSGEADPSRTVPGESIEAFERK